MRIFRGIVIAACILALPAVGAYAASVTVTVVQNEQAPAIAIDMSRAIEDEIFGDLFDSGHIVSNTDIRFDGSGFAQGNFGVKEAAFGYSDFLVALYLEYGPVAITDSEKKTSWAELRAITWRVVRVSDSSILAEKSIDVSKIKVTDFDPYKQSRLVADQVVDATLPVLKKGDTGGSK
jgi:hypothetical protein